MGKVTAADKAYWKRVAKANAILEDEARAEAAKRLPGDKILRSLDPRVFPSLSPTDPWEVELRKEMQEEKSASKANFYRIWNRIQKKKRR